jgi:hypothetical protein
MTWMKKIYDFLSSKTLTVWLVGLFVMYYLTFAVWFEEAFGTFIMGLSSNNIVRSLYIIFLINIISRITGAIKCNLADTFKLFLRLPLYIGIILFFVTSFLSANVRHNRWLIVGEGDTVGLQWEREQFMVTKIDPAIKKKLLRTDDSLIFDYEPVITLMDRNRFLYKVGAFPPEKVSSTYMHILNFGIAPGVELRKGDAVLSKGYVIQRIIPFGATDSFEMEPVSYKFYLRILPNEVVKKGSETARNYDMDKPKYGIEIVQGDRKIFEGESDVSVSFDDDMTLRFFTPTNWIMLEAVYDPFYLWFIVSLVLLIMGPMVFPLSLLKGEKH